MTTVERIAGWAAALGPADVPPEVWALLRAQRRSVLAAIAASTGDEAARRVLGAVAASAPDGPAPLFGTGRRARAEEALYGAAALSIALDFDDYLCFGHTGHSGVLVPLLLAGETGATAERQLVAQAAANEIEARLGAACLVGPLNGQLWSFIHAAGAAIAAGLLLELDPPRLAHALAIALYQVPRPTVPGFMAPDSKLLTAAEPALTGLRAARLAAAGVTGPLDTLDHRQGFLAAFSFAPLTPMLEPGGGWATRTLCIKPYPGCAYVDTVLDALLSLGPVNAADVEAVDVGAGVLTCGMDAMSRPYAGDAPTPVTVTFSVPWNAAIAIVAGRVGPDEISAGFLHEHRTALGALAARVHLHHDAELTARTATALAPVLPLRAAAARLRPRRLLAALLALRREHHAVPLSPADLLRVVPEAVRARAPSRPWDDAALADFRMTFPARVTVRLRGGRRLEATADVPRGAAGHPTAGPGAIGIEKLDRHGPRLFGDRAPRIGAAIDRDEDLTSLLCAD